MSCKNGKTLAKLYDIQHVRYAIHTSGTLFLQLHFLSLYCTQSIHIHQPIFLVQGFE